MCHFVLEYLQNHVVSNRLFSLSTVQQTLVESNSATLALDILFKDGFDEGVVRCLVAAARYVVPFLWLRYVERRVIKKGKTDGFF